MEFGGRHPFARLREGVNGSLPDGSKFQLETGFDLLLILLLFIGAPLLNGLAHLARMLAVKGFRNGLGQAAGLKIVRQHRRPGDGLENCPMATNGREEGGDYNKVTKTAKHGQIIARWLR